MSSFQREIQLPLDEIEKRVATDEISPERVADLEKMCKILLNVEEKNRIFQGRSARLDSPYGDHMKRKIANAAERISKLNTHVNALFEKCQEAYPANVVPTESSSVASESGSDVPRTFSASLSSSVVAEVASDLSTSPAVHDAAFSGFKRDAALHRVRVREAELRTEEHGRHVLMATAERRRREEARERELKELVRVQEEQERQASFKLRLGTVHHVHGSEEYKDIIRLAGKRAFVVDWFAPWCAPCRRAAPVFESLARVNAEVVFITVNTDMEANKPFAHSAAVRVLPTFDVNVDGRSFRRVEGGDMQALETAIAEAAHIAEQMLLANALKLSADGESNFPLGSRTQPLLAISSKTSNPLIARLTSSNDYVIQINLIGPGGGVLGELWVDSSSTVQVFSSMVYELLKSQLFVLTYMGVLLDELRRGRLTLRELGFTPETKVRVIPMPKAIFVYLKIAEKRTSLQMLPSARLRDLRSRARELTSSAQPKLIYSGKVLAPELDGCSLLSLKIVAESTVLCQPFGGPWSNRDEMQSLVGLIPCTNADLSSGAGEHHERFAVEEMFGQTKFLKGASIWLRAESYMLSPYLRQVSAGPIIAVNQLASCKNSGQTLRDIAMQHASSG